MRFFTILLIASLAMSRLFGQSPQTGASKAPVTSISSQTLDKLGNSYSSINSAIDHHSARLLQSLQRKEARMEEKLRKKDSLKAKEVFAASASAYQQFTSKLTVAGAAPTNTLSNYIPSVDSVQTAISFLSKSGLPTSELTKLAATGEQLTKLEGSLANANQLEAFIKQRQTYLQNQLEQFGLSKQLNDFRNEASAYQQQVAEYKDILNDPSQQKKALMEVVNKVPAFQRFWQQNSMLSQLFPMPGNAGTLLASTGLQTASQVGALIQQRMGFSADDGGLGGAQFLQQSAANAQGQIDGLKDKLDHLHMGGGSSDMDLPSKAPNEQARKRFLKRLEYGFNIQNSGGTNFVPAISTIGLSLGYRLTDNATVGIGGSYLVGLGEGINHIRLSNQGIGLRSFIDIRAKGSIWVTGGLEYNYMQQFANIRTIPNIDIWQKSGLIGLTQKYNVGKKTGNIQLLYDMLAHTEIPHGQPIKLRFGFSL